jgi:hypothetical protein
VVGRARGRAPTVLGRRALNRALLERQLLLHRHPMAVADAVEHLVGLQAQTPNGPYLSLWSRLAGFEPSELADLIIERALVRMALMRSTVHLVTAGDGLTLRPLVQIVGERSLRASFGRHFVDLDLDAVVAAGRALLDEKPRTLADLGAALAQRWPGRDPQALGNAVRAYLPLVQLPPRGIWGKGGAAVHATAESWLGRTLVPDPSVDEMVLRYLGAFGPATVADAQKWSGLTRLGEVTERLRDRLVTFRDTGGRELFDLPAAPRPDPDTPSPPRFLPVFDNLLLSHADRTRVLAEDHRIALFGTAALAAGPVLVDGFVAATWTITGAGPAARLVIGPLAPIPAAEQDDVAAEGAALLEFVAPDADPGAIEFLPPGTA